MRMKSLIPKTLKTTKNEYAGGAVEPQRSYIQPPVLTSDR